MSFKEVNEKCWYKTSCAGVGKECHMCVKYLEMNYLMENSWLPKSKQRPTDKLIPFTDHDIDMFERLDNIRLNIETFVNAGKNLYIASDYTGTGKTTWAIKLLLRYFDRVWSGNGLKVRGLFVHVPSLLLRLKDFHSPMSRKEYDLLRYCDLVVWDDIATNELSQYDYTQLIALIDYRMLAEKSNIYTCNVPTYEGLQEIVGDRLASRIYKASEVIIFKGKDNRENGRSRGSSNIK